MIRALVSIGVQRAGTMPSLQAAWEGAHAVRDWALAQGIDASMVATITDEQAKVTPQRIKDEIRPLVESGTVEQLIVYFAGHGMNLLRNEFWLLSDAPDDPDALVNVTASAELARRCTIPHVVILSDACRTAAFGIQMQAVNGSVIFPNKNIGGPEKAVDLFFATALGDPSYEIKDPADAAGHYNAMYTEALVEALYGRHPDATQRDPVTGTVFVRPWTLKDFLADELPRRVFALTQGGNPLSQQPDARITSRPTTWLSLLQIPDNVVPAKFTGSDNEAAKTHAFATKQSIAKSTKATQVILEASNAENAENFDLLLESAMSPQADTTISRGGSFFTRRNQRFVRNARANVEEFGPSELESQCGFKLRGSQAVRGTAFESNIEIAEAGQVVAVKLEGKNCISTLLTLNDGCGVLLPAIGGFIASLTFDGEELIDVAYEPSANSSRWQDYQEHAVELRNLRAVIAAATRQGTFRLEADDAAKLARRMQVAKGIDPSLALYAAHAYRDQGNHDRIREMARFMRNDLNFCPFDIALLAGEFNDKTKISMGDVVPFLPILSQSWALLAATQTTMPEALERIGMHVLPNSLWTLYEPAGVDLISEVILMGKVR